MITIDENGMHNHTHNGDLHREGGPAVYHPTDKTKWKRYYRYGVLHNENGPAVVKADGTKRWFFDGIELSKNDFENGLMVARDDMYLMAL